MTTAPSTWFFKMIGVDDRAALEGRHQPHDAAPCRWRRSTATSAQVAT